MIERILELLKQHNMTAKELTERLGVNRSTVTEWKSGKIKPTIDTVIGMSRIFNVSTDYILTGKPDELSEDARKVLKYYGQLSEENQDYIKGEMVRLYKLQEERQKNIGSPRGAT